MSNISDLVTILEISQGVVSSFSRVNITSFPASLLVLLDDIDDDVFQYSNSIGGKDMHISFSGVYLESGFCVMDLRRLLRLAKVFNLFYFQGDIRILHGPRLLLYLFSGLYAYFHRNSSN